MSGRLPSWAARAIQAIVIITLGLLAMANPGTVSPARHWGGFSSGGWDGVPAHDEDAYRFAILDAAAGLSYSDPGVLCALPGAANSDFLAGANAFKATGDPDVHVFWFLTSNLYASQVCGFSYTAAEWGYQQANNFILVLENWGYTSAINYLLADVEHAAGTECGTDLALWACQEDKALNREVVRGFMDRMNEHSDWTGVYATVDGWETILGEGIGPAAPHECNLTPGGGSPCDVGAKYFWVAHYGATQPMIDADVTHLDALGFRLFSWQYTDDRCFIAETEAAASSKGAAVYLPRWDRWTNNEAGHPDADGVCPESTPTPAE